MEPLRATTLDVKREALPDVCGLANVEAWVGEFGWPPILVFEIDWALARALENDVPVRGHETGLLTNPPERVDTGFFW